MARLTQAQMAMYAAAAGISRPEVAAAIGMAESGGDTNAHNPIGLDDSYGWPQINMRGDLGPARRKALGITSNTALYDPAVAARAMSMISKGGADFTPWSTYTSGKYATHLPAGSIPDAEQAIWGIPNVPTDPWGLITDLWHGGGDVVDGIGNTWDWMGDAVNWLGSAKNWLRVGYVIGGGALVVVGLAMVVKQEGLRQASGAVGKALGSGGKKLGKAVRKNGDG